MAVEVLSSPVLGNQTGRCGDRRSKELILPVSENAKARPQKTIKDHLTLDMAKDLAMVTLDQIEGQTNRMIDLRLQQVHPWPT